MTKLNIIIGILLLSSLSCRQNELLKIDGKSWNHNSFDFILNECNIRMDSLKLGDQIVPLKYKNQIFHTLDAYLNACFENRKLLVAYVNDSIAIKESILIFENYGLNFNINYFIQVDENVKISLEVIDGNLIKKKLNIVIQLIKCFSLSIK